jgi:YHS domain-containing protein
MKKIYAIALMLGFLLLVNNQIVKAQDMSSDTKAIVKASKPQDAGNKTCPVMGGKVSGKDFYEYEGKRYGLCCPMCFATFAGDPDKYSAIADKEVAGK